MKASKKRGFTMIELVIVIAVVAILAAVLIPVFSNLIEQAKEANDTTLVRNLNTAAKLGNKHYDTMYDVLKTVDEEGGYNVSKINAQSKSEILWDMENQCFVMLKDGEEVKSQNKYNYWKIYNKGETIPAAAEQIYSVYVADDTLKTLPEMNVGIDLGDNAKITKVVYKNVDDKKENVVIRTNDQVTVLEITAPKDSVSHYGAAERINVIAVDTNSFHEYGLVKLIDVKSGRVVVENSANVNTVVARPDSESTVKVEVASADTTVYAPDTVQIVGTKSSGVLTTDTQVSNAVSAAKYFAGGLGTEESPYLIATGSDAYNMCNAKGFFKLTSNVVVTDEIYLSGKTCTLDLNGFTLSLVYADDVKPNNGSTISVARGTLTINDSSSAKSGKVYGPVENSKKSTVYSVIRLNYRGKLNINGGYFKALAEETSCIYTFSTGCAVVINGGEFETKSAYNGTYFVLNHQDGSTKWNVTGGSTMTIYGGTFYNYNPGVSVVDPVNSGTGTIKVAEGYVTTEVAYDGGTKYVVSKAE